MLTRLFAKRASQTDVPHQIYGRVVAQARHPLFYETWGVPDTPIGRFELLCLHMFMLSHRLAQEDSAVAASLSQEVFDAFVSDLDRALRQLGIGDTSVPKRKKRMIATFYTQIEQLSAPLGDEDGNALSSSPLVSGLAGMRPFGRAGALSSYMVQAKRDLEAQDLETILAHGPVWPELDRQQ